MTIFVTFLIIFLFAVFVFWALDKLDPAKRADFGGGRAYARHMFDSGWTPATLEADILKYGLLDDDFDKGVLAECRKHLNR